MIHEGIESSQTTARHTRVIRGWRIPGERPHTFSVCQLPSGWCVRTDSDPSEDAAATTRPSSCGAKETLFTEEV